LKITSKAQKKQRRNTAENINEKNPDSERLAIVGIHTRGAVLARRLQGTRTQRN
jgi:pyrimidine operon attenuation protein/uracil phosphoribosyltransferase